MIQFTFFRRQVTLRPQRGPTFGDQLLWDQLLFHRRLSIITSRMSCTYVKPGRGAKDTPTILWIWTQILGAGASVKQARSYDSLTCFGQRPQERPRSRSIRKTASLHPSLICFLSASFIVQVHCYCSPFILCHPFNRWWNDYRWCSTLASEGTC